MATPPDWPHAIPHPHPTLESDDVDHARIPFKSRRCSIAADHDCVLRSYELTVRQQPVHARTCGPGDNADRRPVNPAPIVQLKVMDGDGDETPSSTTPRDERKKLRRDSGPKGMMYMQNPYYFLFACLVGEDEEDDELHVIEDGKTRFLSGTPVSTLYHLKDLDGSDAAFFLFPDLGVRKEGKYKLKLTLFEIVDQQVHYCTTTFTQTFTVYTAKQFPGMTKTSELSTSFSDQGLRIWVRKEARRKTKKRKSSGNDTDEEKARTTSSKRTRGSIPPVYSDRAQPSSRHQMPASSPFPPGYHPSAQPSQGPSGYYPGAPTHAPHAYAPPPSSHGHSAHAHGHRMPPPPPPHGAYDGYYGHGQSRPSSASGYAPHGPYVRPLPTLRSAPPSTYVRPLPILPPAPSSTYGQRSQHDAYGHAPQPHPAHTASYGPPPLASHESGPSREPSRHEAPNVVHPVQHGGHRDAPSYAPHDRDRDRDYPRYAEHPHTRGTPTSTAPTLVRRAPSRASESRPPASSYYGSTHSQHNPPQQIRGPYSSTSSHGYHAPPRSSGRPDPAPHYDDPARPATGSSRSSARSPPLSFPPPPSRPDSRNEGHAASIYGHDHPRAVSRGPAYSPRMADHRLDRGIDRTATPTSASISTAYEQHYPPPYAHAPIRPTASRDGQTSVRLPGLADSIPPPLQNAGGGPPSRPGSGMTLPPLVTPQHRSAAPAGVPPGPPGTASSTRSVQSNQSGTSGRELGSRDGRDAEVRDGRDGREGRGGRDETSNVRGQSVGAASTVSSATTPGGTKTTNRMGLGHLMD